MSVTVAPESEPPDTVSPAIVGRCCVIAIDRNHDRASESAARTDGCGSLPFRAGAGGAGNGHRARRPASAAGVDHRTDNLKVRHRPFRDDARSRSAIAIGASNL